MWKVYVESLCGKRVFMEYLLFVCINNFETGKEHFLNKYMLHFN